MRRGEIWWGAPSLAGGARKPRPFLVVSADAFNANPRYPKVMVVHLTTVPRATVPDWEVPLPRGTGGLPSASIAKCGEVYTILKDQLASLVGTAPRVVMDRLDDALSIALGLPPPQQ